jgi:hypothetical protein
VVILTPQAGISTPTSSMLQRYLIGPVPNISNGILSVLFTLEIIKMSCIQFSGDITDSLNFHSA